ncbi:MAG TPA: peptidoglycan bridge formation glycyltransferase FemA/FemB family protein [Patescibacteria group bacterium]|jgi:lipid II:glycine glycyltransferase (peptidoglycan interpeptide bridge formation enzyme)|nr:peptidoglycan bridge formation glycyltransferase FemA/FemB family protein [Patescibacteria group bacterium]
MISDLTQEQWDKKTIELGGSILQSWAWGEFQESLGLKIFRFSGDDFVNLAVETPMPAGKKYLYCPRGPLGNVDAALADLKKFKDDRTLVFSRIEPTHKVDLPISPKEIQPTHNWMLSLTKTEQELLIGMKPKTRYNINLAQRKGVKVRVGTKEDLIPLYQLLLETAGRNGFKLHPQNYYWQAVETMFPRYLKILIAEYQGKPLAGMLLSLFGDTATYLHGGSASSMKEAMAPYLLHWEAIKLSKSMGLSLYDFGGVTANASQDHAWVGLSRFKKGFGGFEVVFPGAFDLIYSPVWYNVYKHVRNLRKRFS